MFYTTVVVSAHCARVCFFRNGALFFSFLIFSLDATALFINSIFVISQQAACLQDETNNDLVQQTAGVKPFY